MVRVHEVQRTRYYIRYRVSRVVDSWLYEQPVRHGDVNVLVSHPGLNIASHTELFSAHKLVYLIMHIVIQWDTDNPRGIIPYLYSPLLSILPDNWVSLQSQAVSYLACQLPHIAPWRPGLNFTSAAHRALQPADCHLFTPEVFLFEHPLPRRHY